MTAAAADLRVTRQVRITASRRREFGCQALRHHSFGEDSCVLQRLVRDGMAGIVMALSAESLFGVGRMWKAALERRGDGGVTTYATSRGDVRRHRQREHRVAEEVRPDLPEGDELVSEPRGQSRLDMTRDALDVGVRPCRPRVVVGRHLVARSAERGLVGVERDPDERRQQQHRDDAKPHEPGTTLRHSPLLTRPSVAPSCGIYPKPMSRMVISVNPTIAARTAESACPHRWHSGISSSMTT